MANIKQVDLFNFIGLMAQEMEANEKKGPVEVWIEKDPRTLLFDMLYHAAKLSAAIRENEPEKVKEFAADCANLSMMTLLAYQHQKDNQKNNQKPLNDSDCGYDNDGCGDSDYRGRYAHGATSSS